MADEASTAQSAIPHPPPIWPTDHVVANSRLSGYGVMSWWSAKSGHHFIANLASTLTQNTYLLTKKSVFYTNIAFFQKLTCHSQKKKKEPTHQGFLDKLGFLIKNNMFYTNALFFQNMTCHPQKKKEEPIHLFFLCFFFFWIPKSKNHKIWEIYPDVVTK